MSYFAFHSPDAMLFSRGNLKNDTPFFLSLFPSHPYLILHVATAHDFVIFVTWECQSLPVNDMQRRGNLHVILTNTAYVGMSSYKTACNHGAAIRRDYLRIILLMNYHRNTKSR